MSVDYQQEVKDLRKTNKLLIDKLAEKEKIIRKIRVHTAHVVDELVKLVEATPGEVKKAKEIATQKTDDFFGEDIASDNYPEDED